MYGCVIYRLLEAKSLLGLREDTHNQHALTVLMEVKYVIFLSDSLLYTCTLHLQLFEKGSCDRHVIVALSRAHLALGDVESAEKVIIANEEDAIYMYGLAYKHFTYLPRLCSHYRALKMQTLLQLTCYR